MWQVTKSRPLTLSYIASAGVIVMVISFFLQGTILFFAGTAFLILSILPSVYLNYLSKGIVYDNASIRKRVMVGENGDLVFTIQNRSALPLNYGHCRIEFDDHLEILHSTDGKRTAFISPFSVSRQGAITFKVPFKSLKRGWVRAKTLKIVLHDPLRLSSVNLTFNSLLRTEMIIYPELSPLNKLKDLLLLSDGSTPQQASLFSDYTQVTGTRDYEFSDPLKFVHWKASARMGQLQTKVFEKVSGIYWTLIFVLDTGHANYISTEHLEKSLSMAAYMTQFAEKHHIAFDLYINIKTKGSLSGTYLGMEQGVQHLMKAWELLSLVDLSYIRIHPDQAWGYIDRQMSDPRMVFIYLTDVKSGHRRYANGWMKRGHRLFHVKENGAVMGLTYSSGKDKREGEALA